MYFILLVMGGPRLLVNNNKPIRINELDSCCYSCWPSACHWVLTKHNLASIVVQQMVQCLLNWIFPLLSTIVVIVGDWVHIYHPRANLCTTLMTSPSPPLVGEDCLEGVETVRAAQDRPGLSRRLLDLSCLPIQLYWKYPQFVLECIGSRQGLLSSAVFMSAFNCAQFLENIYSCKWASWKAVNVTDSVI